MGHFCMQYLADWPLAWEAGIESRFLSGTFSQCKAVRLASLPQSGESLSHKPLTPARYSWLNTNWLGLRFVFPVRLFPRWISALREWPNGRKMDVLGGRLPGLLRYSVAGMFHSPESPRWLK